MNVRFLMKADLEGFGAEVKHVAAKRSCGINEMKVISRDANRGRIGGGPEPDECAFGPVGMKFTLVFDCFDQFLSWLGFASSSQR